MIAVDPQNDPTPVERSLSIGTWNMDHWKRTSQQRQDAWDYLRTSSKSDVMLLQESVAPSGIPRNRFVYREIAGRRPWGSSVVAFAKELEIEEIDAVGTRYGSTRSSMLGSLPGSVIVARVHVPEIGPITCVSVYGMMDDGYAQTRMFRVIADLIPLFDSDDGRRVILGGDFNVTTAAGPDTPELPRYQAILTAIESLGLVNLAATVKDRPDPMPGCPCGTADCRHVRTYGDNPGKQLDWLYATKELAHRCTRLRVDHTVMDTLSDHAPLIAEFKVPPLKGGTVVDPDSFVQELGVCKGPECARITEDLIAWAHGKHVELEGSGPRVAYFNRMPTRNTAPPEIWFQLDSLPLADGKGLLQWTFSIKDDRVVVQFQYMSAPFDTMNARKELWFDLCRIEGVTLDERLNGRPSFPLKNLAQSERREQFQRVFSKLIDKTLQDKADAD